MINVLNGTIILKVPVVSRTATGTLTVIDRVTIPKLELELWFIRLYYGSGMGTGIVIKVATGATLASTCMVFR